MGISKLQRARCYYIDRELAKKEFVKTKDLVEKISNELIPVSQRQIQIDLKLMRENEPTGFAAPIGYNKKEKAFYYTDRNFTIQAFGLKEDDVQALLFYAKTLNQFKGIKLFQDVLKAIEKVVDKLLIGKEIKKLIADRTLIQAEKAPICKGLENISPIMKAILENQKIEFNYAKFDQKESHIRVLSPILLKEDKHFWYVLGFLENNERPTTFALDRMSNLRVTNVYFSPQSFDADNHFQYSFGITVPNSTPLDIVLSFQPFQGNYIKALPIHGTQNIIIDNSEELRITIKAIPSYEIYSKILSYGENVKVISPPEVLSEIKNRIKATAKLYK